MPMMSRDVTGMLQGGGVGWGGSYKFDQHHLLESSPISPTLHVMGVGHEGDQFKI